MGGAATEKYGTTRISKDEYPQFVSQLKELARSYGLNPRIPRELPGKESFGDVDLLLTWNDADRPGFKEFKAILTRDGFTPNGNVTSCAYKGHQVDIILTRQDNIDFTYFYLSYGFVGMILGVISRQLGFKFSLDGLYLRGKDKFEDILLTRDILTATQFLGVDYHQWEQGFNTVEDVYAFITNSRFAYVLSDLKVNGNAIHRKRENQSPAYNKFFTWFKDNIPQVDYHRFRSYDAFVLLGRFNTDMLDKALTQIKEQLLKKFLSDMEARRFDFDTFSEIQLSKDSSLDKPALGKRYGEFKKRLQGKKDKLTSEIITHAQQF